MPDLLFISDNPKVEQIKDLLQPLLKLEIGATTSCEHALKDISGHYPRVVCIQEGLAGTTAGEIAEQIQALPASEAPLFVLLREESDDALPPAPPFEHVIDLNQPVERLVKSILRVVLRPAFRLRWNDIYIHHDRNAAAATVPKQEKTEPAGANAALPKIQIPAELLKAFEHNYHARHRGRWITCAAVSLTACLAVFGWYATSGRHDQSSRTAPTAPLRPEVAPAAPRPPQAKKHVPPPPAPSVATIVQKAPSTSRKPAASKATAVMLPSFIPAAGRDNSYSRQKPGWERYKGTNYEFRLLRSGGRIKAIQVLAATQHAISETFLKSVLKEISGNSTYQETSQEEDQGFLIKRGNAGAGTTILIYTQNSRIRAFVISMR